MQHGPLQDVLALLVLLPLLKRLHLPRAARLVSPSLLEVPSAVQLALGCARQRDEQRRRALTYIQPITVWQFMHEMSATQCSPVNNSRSSFGPRVTFTLRTGTTLTRDERVQNFVAQTGIQ